MKRKLTTVLLAALVMLSACSKPLKTDAPMNSFSFSHARSMPSIQKSPATFSLFSKLYFPTMPLTVIADKCVSASVSVTMASV